MLKNGWSPSKGKCLHHAEREWWCVWNILLGCQREAWKLWLWKAFIMEVVYVAASLCVSVLENCSPDPRTHPFIRVISESLNCTQTVLTTFLSVPKPPPKFFLSQLTGFIRCLPYLFFPIVMFRPYGNSSTVLYSSLPLYILWTQQCSCDSSVVSWLVTYNVSLVKGLPCVCYPYLWTYPTLLPLGSAMGETLEFF